jgi:hypothetical protein
MQHQFMPQMKLVNPFRSSDMITVTRRLLSEEEILAKLAVFAQRYHISRMHYDESVASRMSEFDALKWMSLLDLLNAVKRGNGQDSSTNSNIPYSLRSIYGMYDASRSEELENTCELIELAA